MAKRIRKELISGTLLIIGLILLFNFVFNQGQVELLFGVFGVFLIVVGISYWFYIWPDEFASRKDAVEEDLTFDTDKDESSTQSRDLENITFSGFNYGVDNRRYFGGVDRRPNQPKNK